MNPDIRVVARAPSGEHGLSLAGSGADEVVQPEFEAGLEFVRRVLRWQGVSARETTALVSWRRTAFYEPARVVTAEEEG